MSSDSERFLLQQRYIEICIPGDTSITWTNSKGLTYGVNGMMLTVQKISHEFYWGSIEEGAKCMEATFTAVKWRVCSAHLDENQSWRYDPQTEEVRNLAMDRGCLTTISDALSVAACTGAANQKFVLSESSDKTRFGQNNKCINRVGSTGLYTMTACMNYGATDANLANNQWSTFKYIKDYSLVNVALNARTYQSTTGWGGIAHYAVDGDLGTHYTHTGDKGAPPVSWSVDLGRDYKVEIITIYNSLNSDMSHGPNIDGAKVYLNATLCATISHVSGQVKYEVKCSGNDANGRIIKIESAGGKNLTLLEVEVMSAGEPRFTVENTHIINKAQTSTLTIYRDEVKADLDYTCTIKVETADFKKDIKKQTFTLGSETDEVHEGHKATLTCTTAGLMDTSVNVKWVKDNIENTYTAQDSSSGYQVITSSNSAGVMTSKLVIDEANTKQDGVYTCMLQVNSSFLCL